MAGALPFLAGGPTRTVQQGVQRRLLDTSLRATALPTAFFKNDCKWSRHPTALVGDD